mmetsp:Transcript_97822/g.232932  ORF Transcript_97822/g.232932 Transcript_97822/m.232932 type:complete len:115 (+) Transcript_97822:76-420(+)
MMRALLLALLLPACSAITWVKSAAGASCDQACAARDGCSDESWPQSEEEFQDAARAAGQVCESTQSGGAKYDPSTDGHHCGWQGPEDMNGESRCGQAGDSGTYRFCPCIGDKEL